MTTLASPVQRARMRADEQLRQRLVYQLRRIGWESGYIVCGWSIVDYTDGVLVHAATEQLIFGVAVRPSRNEEGNAYACLVRESDSMLRRHCISLRFDDHSPENIVRTIEQAVMLDKIASGGRHA